MSLNKYEQTLFEYIDRHPEERRYWHAKIQGSTHLSADPAAVVRGLEREMWEYYTERSQHVPVLCELNPGGVRRVSLLNLTEYLLRLWGPQPRPKKPASPDNHAAG
jgi:hypothetical protein